MSRINIPPPITRILLITLLTQSFLSFVIRYQNWNGASNSSSAPPPYVALSASASQIFYFWTFITTTLVENNVFTLGIAGVTLFYGGRFLERSFGSLDFAKFLIVSSLIPNLLTFGTLVILFAITGSTNWT